MLKKNLNIGFFNMFDSLNDFVHGNMSLAFDSLRVFISNYVFYSFGLILRYFFRFGEFYFFEFLFIYSFIMSA
jgi:hypothetical protein